MNNNAIPQKLSPLELYAVIYQNIFSCHLNAQAVLSPIKPSELHFTSDTEVIDAFHHLFEQAGDPYSCVLHSNEAGADIDPENGDQTPDISFEKMPTGEGLIKISKFRYNTCADNFENALKALSNCSSLVIDLRDNPGGLHLEALEIAQCLLDEGNLGSQMLAGEDTSEIVDYELHADRVVTTTSDLQGKVKQSSSAQRRPNLATNKSIVVLVNENTKSAAEVLASILQDNKRATLIGKKTFGKGRGTINLQIPNGLELQILGFYWLTPGGQCIGTGPDDPNKGIKPDFEI